MRSDSPEMTLLSLKNEAVFYFGLQLDVFSSSAISCKLFIGTMSLQLRISLSHYLHLQTGWLAFSSIMQQFHLSILQKKLWVRQIQVAPISSNTPTLVFLHEGLGSVAQWKEFPLQLCEKMGCNGIVYDRQGHGKSSAMTEKRGKDYLHIEALQYLPELLQKLQIEYPILIGHSDGGTIALIYAANFPQQVKAIVTEAAHIKVEDITIQCTGRHEATRKVPCLLA